MAAPLFQATSFPAVEFADAIRSEKKMLPLMEGMLSLAQKYSADLSSHGQTPEVITRGLDLLAELRDADAAQELKKDDKQAASQTRYQQFAQLYETVNRINKVGRLVFKDDPARLTLFESKWPRSASPAEQPD